jgi:predicted AAA+ superfamily ATPase
VDFYIPEKQELIQVSYSISDPETAKREIKGLRDAMKELKITNSWIITYDESNEIIVDEGIIQVIPAWQWLLNI